MTNEVTGRTANHIRAGASQFDGGPGPWWSESAIGSDQARFGFVETSRDDWSVRVHDGKRDVWLRFDLHVGTVFIRYGDGQESPLYTIDAAEARPRPVVAPHVTVASKGAPVGRFAMVGPGRWAEFGHGSSTETYTFVERSRDAFGAVLHAADRNLDLQFDLRSQQVRIRYGAGAFSKLYDIVDASLASPPPPPRPPAREAPPAVEPPASVGRSYAGAQRRTLVGDDQSGYRPHFLRWRQFWDDAFVPAATDGGSAVDRLGDKWVMQNISPVAVSVGNGALVALSVAAGEVLAAGALHAAGVSAAITLSGLSAAGVLGSAGLGLALAVPIALAVWQGKTTLLIANATGSDLKIHDPFSADGSGIFVAQGQVRTEVVAVDGHPGQHVPVRPTGNLIEGVSTDFAGQDFGDDDSWGPHRGLPSIGIIVMDRLAGFDGIGGVVTLEDADGRLYRIAHDNRPYGGPNAISAELIEPGASVLTTAEDFYRTSVQHGTAVKTGAQSMSVYDPTSSSSQRVSMTVGLNRASDDAAVIAAVIGDSSRLYVPNPEASRRVVLRIADGKFEGRFLYAPSHRRGPVTCTESGLSIESLDDRAVWEVVSSDDVLRGGVSLRSAANQGYLTLYENASATTTSEEAAEWTTLTRVDHRPDMPFGIPDPWATYSAFGGTKWLSIQSTTSVEVRRYDHWATPFTVIEIPDDA